MRSRCIDGGDLRIYFVVYDPTGAVAASTNGEMVAALSFSATLTGTYTVVLTQAIYNGGAAAGAYSLYYAQAPGARELGVLYNGVTVTDSLDLGDLDSFTFTAPAKSRVEVVCTDLANGPLRPYVNIYNSIGALVAQHNSETAASATFMSDLAGSYTVIVGDSIYNGVLHTGSYSIVASGIDALQMADAGVDGAIAACDLNMCACGLDPLGTVSASTAPEPVGHTVMCPVFGKRLTFSAAVSGSISGAPPSCPECKATLSASAKLEGSVGLCGGLDFKLAGSGTYDFEKQFSATCDHATCALSCDPNSSCSTHVITGTVEAGVSRFVPFQFRKRAAKLELAARCGVTVAGNLQGSIERRKTIDGGFSPCVECSKNTVGLSGSISGKGGCGVSFFRGKVATHFGCEECASASAELAGGTSRQSGACGAQGCDYAKLSARATFSVSTRCVSFGWFSAPIQCSGTASGEAIADTCTGTSFKPDASATCNVSAEEMNRKMCESKP